MAVHFVSETIWQHLLCQARELRAPAAARLLALTVLYLEYEADCMGSAADGARQCLLSQPA